MYKSKMAVVAAILWAGAAAWAAGDAGKGKDVFEQNCSVCHNADSQEQKIGPGIKGLFKKSELANKKKLSDKNVLDFITNGSPEKGIDSASPAADRWGNRRPASRFRGSLYRSWSPDADKRAPSYTSSRGIGSVSTFSRFPVSSRIARRNLSQGLIATMRVLRNPSSPRDMCFLSCFGPSGTVLHLILAERGDSKIPTK